MAKAPALGKGLGALISGGAASIQSPQPGERVLRLKLDQIVPSPLQPRKEIGPEQLAELTQSIRESGIIQPLIVRKVGATYELIAGERRWRASQEVGLAEAPVILREASDREVLELALVENLQREDLNPIEEANAYARLSREFSMTQEDIARRVGKNRATVANSMRLLDLPAEVQSYVRRNLLSVGHAKALLSVKDHASQILLAEKILRESAPVRAAERLVSQFLKNSDPMRSEIKSKKSRTRTTSPAIQRLENLLQERLATRVVIHDRKNGGDIQLEYYGADDLDRILRILGIENPD